MDRLIDALRLASLLADSLPHIDFAYPLLLSMLLSVSVFACKSKPPKGNPRCCCECGCDPERLKKMLSTPTPPPMQKPPPKKKASPTCATQPSNGKKPEPATKPKEKPNKKCADEPASKPAAEKPNDKPTNKPKDKTTNKTDDKPTGKPISKPACKAATADTKPVDKIEAKTPVERAPETAVQSSIKKDDKKKARVPKEQLEDTFDQKQPVKEDCKRAEETDDGKVANQGDYKTWNRYMDSNHDATGKEDSNAESTAGGETTN